MTLEANCEKKSQNCQIGIKPPVGGPISSQISPNGHKLIKWHGGCLLGQLLHIGQCGCGKRDGLDSQCNINCTKSSQIWAKSHSSTPSQLAYPHSMNGSEPRIMDVHMWLDDQAGVPMWVIEPQVDMAYVHLSTPSPPHSVLKLKKEIKLNNQCK